MRKKYYKNFETLKKTKKKDRARRIEIQCSWDLFKVMLINFIFSVKGET
jgi:hypothetical protein